MGHDTQTGGAQRAPRTQRVSLDCFKIWNSSREEGHHLQTNFAHYLYIRRRSLLFGDQSKALKGGGGPSNTTVIILNNDVESYIRATCFDSTESSSGPRVSDPHEECTTHCGIPNAYNKRQNYKTNNKTECM